MNFKKLENNLLDMIQEQQVKIGYMSGVTRFYYPPWKSKSFFQKRTFLHHSAATGIRLCSREPETK